MKKQRVIFGDIHSEHLGELYDECNRTWIAAGCLTPCHEPAYLAARLKYHDALVAARLMNKSDSDRNRPTKNI